MQYPKCKHCGHSKTKHKLLQNYPQGMCFDCFSFFNNGPNYEWEFDADAERVSSWNHGYHPDNLTYIEKLAERRGLV